MLDHTLLEPFLDHAFQAIHHFMQIPLFAWYDIKTCVAEFHKTKEQNT